MYILKLEPRNSDSSELTTTGIDLNRAQIRIICRETNSCVPLSYAEIIGLTFGALGRIKICRIHQLPVHQRKQKRPLIRCFRFIPPCGISDTGITWSLFNYGQITLHPKYTSRSQISRISVDSPKMVRY